MVSVVEYREVLRVTPNGITVLVTHTHPHHSTTDEGHHTGKTHSTGKMVEHLTLAAGRPQQNDSLALVVVLR